MTAADVDPAFGAMGEMADLFRAHDWSTSPVGEPETWPQPLRSAIQLILANKHLMFVAWGPELAFLYNDGYRPVFGQKHPWALGRPFKEVWSEIWDDIQPLVETALAGEATWSEDLHLVMERNGYPEDTWYTFSYSPLRDESGAIAGMFCAGTETTQQVLSERRRSALLKLDDRLRDVIDPEETAQASAELLGEALGACRVGYGDLDTERETITVGRTWSVPGLPDVAGVHAFKDYGTYIADLKRGVPVAVSDVTSDPRTADRAAQFQSLGIAAFLDAPVMEGGRAVAEVFAHAPGPRSWSEDEVAVALEFAHRTRAAVARRRADAALCESEVRYRTLFDTIDEGFCVIEFIDGPHGELSDYVHVQANPAYTRHAGIPDIVGKRLREIVSDKEADAWVETYRGVLLTGQPIRFDRELVETGRHLELAAFPVESADHRQVAVLFQDITLRRRAEVALQALNADLQSQVAERTEERNRTWEVSTDLLSIVLPDGSFQTLNPAWEATLGWSEEELRSKNWFERVHPDDLKRSQDGFSDLLSDKPVLNFENRYRRKSGGYCWLQWVAVPAGGRFYCRARDVTAERAQEAELALAQEALRQSQKMESMGQLTGGVAHDFNNLLTPIVGALDLLQRKGVGGEREQRLIDGALQSSDRAKTLVQRLLAFARRQPLQSTAVDISELVTGMADLLASTSGPQIRVVVEAPPGLPLASADANQLEMALLNLGVNARDAMPDGGTVRISASAERVRAGHRSGLPPGDYVRLSVADTGVGMDELTIARSVEPFFSTKGIGKGTGLGLSMVHGLASQLGGALTIDSRPGLGTNIGLWLPRTKDEATPAKPREEPSNNRDPRGSVLLVDDEDLVRTSTADMLAELGYSVIEARSGEEAMNLVEGGLEPDLLVTDHLMPGMSGTDLARALLTRDPELPVLVVSGYTDLEGIASDLPRLTKPFRNADLAASLASLESASAN